MTGKDEIIKGEKLTLKDKMYFSAGYLGTNATSGLFMSSLIIFYREQLLLPEIYIFWAYMLFIVWNAVNDPLFGWLSDRTSTKWGRRIPYLMICAPILAFSFFLMWASPHTDVIGDVPVFIWLTLSMLLFDTAFTAANIALNSLSQEITMVHKERANLQVIVMAFGLVGMLMALLLPMAFLDMPGTSGFLFMALIISIAQLISMWIVAFKVKERLEFSHVDDPLSFIDSMKHTFKSKAFLITVSMNFCVIFVNNSLLENLFFFIYYAFEGLDETVVLIMIVLSLLVGIFSGILYFIKLNKKKGLKITMTRSLLSMGLGLVLIGILPGFFSIIGFFLTGFGFFGALSLITTIFGHIADEDEVKTGIRREAAIFGANAFVTKPAQSVAGGFTALMLLFFQYQEPVGGVRQVQSAFTVLGLKLTIGIIPGIIILLGALIFSFFPIYGRYYEDIKSKMSTIQKARKDKYIQKVKKA